MKRLLVLLLLMVLPLHALAEWPPAIPFGGLRVTSLTLPGKKALPVYSGPGKNYVRAAKGKAVVSPADWVQIFASEGGYTLVQYELDFRRYRFGWVKGEYAPAADFCRARAAVTRDTELTDDPLGQHAPIATLPAGTPITWLTNMSSAWIYVEAEMDGKLLRGFVLKDHIILMEPNVVYADELYPIRQDGLWGYMNYQGNVVIEPQFAYAEEFRGMGYAEAATVSDTHPLLSYTTGIIDKKGDWIVEPHYAFDSGYDGYWYGGLDTGITYLLDEAHDPSPGFFDFLYGRFTPCPYDGFSSPWVSETNSLMTVANPDADSITFGVLDRSTGKLVIPYKFLESMNAICFTDGLTLVYAAEDDELHYMDTEGRFVPLPKGIKIEDEYCVPTENRAPVTDIRTGLYGFVDATGTLAIPADFSEVGSFSEGLCAACPAGSDLYGYIDRQGRWEIEPQFDAAEEFVHGLATVCKGKATHLVDTAGHIIYTYTADGAPTWYQASNIYGVSIVSDYALIDKAGHTLSPGGMLTRPRDARYDQTFDSLDFEEGLQAFVDASTGLMGYVDTLGQVAIPFEWDEAYRFRHGLARVETDGRMAYIDHSGAIVWQESK